MNPQRLAVRFRLPTPPPRLDPAIPVFHRFIQRGLVEGLILDVADYRHVPQGPGVLLVGHDVDYGVNDIAFSTVRKRSADDDAATQLRDTLRMGLGAIDAVIDDAELDLEVDRSRFTLAVHDRALGTADEIESAMLDELEPVLGDLYGSDVAVSPVESDDPRRPAELFVEADPTTAQTVLEALGGARPPGQSPWDIPVEQLARMRETQVDHLLLDVREESEYETVNLGGQLIPLAQVADRAGELDPNQTIVVHCRAGHRGAKAVAQLRAAGLPDVWNLNGGLVAWSDRIDPSVPTY